MSRATSHFDDADLLDMLTDARAYNSTRDITGILIYDDRLFIQLLEGDKADVEELMEKISADRRHHGIVYLLKELSPFGRLFPQWSMGFRHMRALDRSAIPGLEPSGLKQTTEYIRTMPESLAGRIILNVINHNSLRSV